ncbi:MAG: hypothetical protein KME25_01775 [Symplocastrum torsivum CPER-KK1]|jgi:hypothetical protein|uniref:Uncharacterized protein n=1 Tax=Symplocastrum torsivum CPER-KK1 TaxID=450513 RepID=A0A951PGS3_9CYAN|nr:hypothetical protein [Symplocastrum torsivum CPER-KK1]
MPKLTTVVLRAVNSAKFLLDIAASGAAIATVLGFAGSLWWVFELIEHLRPQYCLVLVTALVIGGISPENSGRAFLPTLKRQGGKPTRAALAAYLFILSNHPFYRC